jgi:hypothetical protein
MDIGSPYRDLGPVDADALIGLVESLPAEAWTRNTFRRDALAGGEHEAADAIVFRHEWDRDGNSLRLPYMEQLVLRWAATKGLDPVPFMPIAAQVTDMGRVYTFPDILAFREALGPVVRQVKERLGCPGGVVTRLALVSLPAGARVRPHVDGQPLAVRAHRVHVALTESPEVGYTVGGRSFAMRRGHAYDLNNRRRHAVANEGKEARVNLFVDVLPDPAFVRAVPVLRAPAARAPAMRPPTMRPPTAGGAA